MYRDYELVGTALQLPPGAWPADRETFRAWWDARLDELVVDDVTRDVAHQLLHPRAVPLALRLAMPLARLVTTGLLPDRLRGAFRLPWGPARARAFGGVLLLCRLVVPRLPSRLRHVLRDHYLRRLRAYLARG